MPLTASQVKTAKPSSKPFKMADGHGLFLLVNPNNSKYWRMKYRFSGKEKLLSFGVYPDVSLSEARVLAEEARRVLRNKEDPSIAKKNKKNEFVSDSDNSFQNIATEWFNTHLDDKSQSYKERTWRILSKDLFPQIGELSIDQISASLLLACLRKIEDRTIDIAHRARQTASQVFRFAIATARAERNIAADLIGALRPKHVRHIAAITKPEDVGKLLQAIDAYPGTDVVRTALRLSPLLFVRPGELRQMEWDEINWEASRWEIAADKMKMKEPHIVPLAKQSHELLRGIQPITGRGRYVFPSARGGSRPLSDNGVRTALRSMEYDNETMSPHGFRAMARTLLDEVLNFRLDLIEHQLAHAVKDPLGRAYNRSTYLPERIEMMQVWADYLDMLKDNPTFSVRKRSNPEKRL